MSSLAAGDQSGMAAVFSEIDPQRLSLATALVVVNLIRAMSARGMVENGDVQAWLDGAALAQLDAISEVTK